MRLAILRQFYLKFVGIIAGISIPPGVFGPGLSIPHYGSVIVNDKVRAGRFCRIHSGVNIGENRGSAPVLGDGVYFGPGAVAYGDIVIGNRCVVGANSVVNTSFGNDAVIAGAPAKQIGSSGIMSAMPAWIIKEMSDLVE
ncbi:serine O-acetyltransferase [Rhodococcus sp. NCIMB 12038]|uniref:serine O-acetyltransferase n=1 Tax=Rhodococcus sp. NCIMB 12038 TaxID=933800 RepID=UPI00358F299C